MGGRGCLSSHIQPLDVPVTVIDFVRILRRNWMLLVVGALIGAAVGAAYLLTRPTYYVATSTGIVVAGDSASVGNVMAGNSVAEQRAGSYITLLNTGAVAAGVAQDLEKLGNPAAAGGSYSARVVAGTSLMNVSATGATPQNAQDLANAALRALSVEALRLETYAQTQGNEVSVEEMRKLTSIYILAYEPAVLPSSPVRTDAVQTVGIGLALGLALAASWALVRKQFDVRVRTQADVEELTGHAVLGVIPDTRDLKKQREAPGSVLDMGHAGEALRQLRTNLRFAKVDQPPRAVVVTSANPGEGKSTIASNLAALIAKSGQDVVLIDGDLRKPMQATIFGLDAQIGLTQVLAGDVTVEDALVQTPTERLSLLPSGRIPPNPSELAGSRRMQELIEDLARTHFVVVDAPPLLSVTDGGLLAAASDGAILVGVVGKTHKAEMAMCTKQLAQVGAAMLGSVLNKAPRSTMGDVLYGHYGAAKYYNSYYMAADGKKKRRADSSKPLAEIPVQVGSTRGGARRSLQTTDDAASA